MDRYDICITALPADAEIAGILRRSLLRYRLPGGITLPEGQEYRRIATDVSGSELDEAVCSVLEQSRFLVLLCSPQTHSHRGILKRLDYFRAQRGGDHVVVVLVEGEPVDSFPVNFSEVKMVRHIMPDMSVVERMEKIEPVAADLRGETDARRREKLRYETVRIIAAVLGFHPDVLEQRHRARRRRVVLAALGLIAAVSLGTAGIFLRLGLIAKQEGDIAREQTQLSVQIVERTLEELPVLFEGDDLAMEYVEEAMESARKSLQELGLDELLSDETEAVP